MNVAGIVVYNPNIERLTENINAIINQIDYLVLYCNSVFDETMFEDNEKIVYINDGVNKGISSALNGIMKFAKNAGAEWCLLLDQDSVVPYNIISEYEKYTHDNTIAVITPVIYDELEKSAKKICNDNIYIDMCITSGSYNKISVWEKIGGFIEDYFIDYVDWEYCARVRKKGYKIALVKNINLNHQLGKLTYHNFFGIKISTYNHNATRKYYITRNSIVTYKLYPYEEKLKYPYLRIMKRLVIVVLYEKDKISKMKGILNGIKDSKRLFFKLKNEVMSNNV